MTSARTVGAAAKAAQALRPARIMIPGINAPMNGTIVALLVEPGQKVEKGQPILIMEAMKMEHSIVAPQDGMVESFYFNAGELVDGGATLLSFVPDSADADKKDA